MIALVQLPVSDLERSRRFYRDGLGLRPSLDGVGSFTVFELEGGGPGLQLLQVSDHVSPMTGLVVGFELAIGADVLEVLARVKEVGGTIKYDVLKGSLESDWHRRSRRTRD